MEDPVRLAEEGDAFERGLLESARLDVGSAAAEASSLQLLAAQAPVAPTALLSKGLMLLLGTGFAASALLLAWLLAPGPDARPNTPTRANTALAPREPATPLTQEVRETAPLDTTPLPQPAVIEAREPKPRRRGAAARGRSLGEEVALLQTVRQALTAGDPAAALNGLERHALEFKSGALQLEAGVLRVQVLLALGDTLAARKSGAQFLAAHPEGPHAKRVRNLLSNNAQP